jgi:hypothetical protein
MFDGACSRVRMLYRIEGWMPVAGTGLRTGSHERNSLRSLDDETNFYLIQNRLHCRREGIQGHLRCFAVHIPGSQIRCPAFVNVPSRLPSMFQANYQVTIPA